MQSIYHLFNTYSQVASKDGRLATLCVFVFSSPSPPPSSSVTTAVQTPQTPRLHVHRSLRVKQSRSLGPPEDGGREEETDLKGESAGHVVQDLHRSDPEAQQGQTSQHRVLLLIWAEEERGHVRHSSLKTTPMLLLSAALQHPGSD